MRVEVETTILAIFLSAGSLASASTLKARGNPFGIDYDPAPSPEDGPPLSAGALRDPTYLPAEIGGIVGAYVLIASAVGIALLFIGRRRRQVAARIREKLDVELTQPSFSVIQTYPSPLSPGGTTRNFSWPSPEKDGPNPYVFPPVRSPISPVASDPNVDSRIVEKDRDYLQRNLEDLYAHVMAQEEAKAAGIVLTDSPAPLPLLSPGPVPQTSPQRNTLSKLKNRPSNLEVNSEKSHSRTSSIISSIMSPKKKGIRGMRISEPIPTPLQATFPANYASDEEPLSPRNYAPPPPPPVPTAENPYPYQQHSRNNSTDPSPISPARSVAEQLTQYNVPQHRYNDSQTSFQSTRNPLASNPAPNSTSPRPVQNSMSPRPLPSSPRPAQLSIRTAASNPPSNPPSNNNSTRALPFRAFDPPPGLSSPSFAPTTKTTVLERAAPLSPGLRTPFTAGAVPYSPYMPFTPLMPMSPRLVTREDRKAEKKKTKRMPVLEMVGSDDEMWDGAY